MSAPTGRQRMALAMRPREGRLPDRVPIMCQLALGHYFLHAGGDAIEIWHDGRAFADALVALARRYRFDGILVNLPGRDPRWRDAILDVDERPGERVIHWKSGHDTAAPPDDNPHVSLEGRPVRPGVDEIEPGDLFYVEPHGLPGPGYPRSSRFPAWQWDTLKLVRAAAPDLSVHGEVFSPFSQLLELLGCSEGLLALMLAPAKVAACLGRLAQGAIALGRGHFAAGADAVLISSAYAGAGFISREHYSTFVLPYERAVVLGLKAEDPGRPVYTHTCGAIGDRLDLMEATRTDGIDTLDPPPLGTTDLREARAQLGGRLFVKGNVDPVNTVLMGDADACYRDACARIAVAKQAGPFAGGYILSTACSVPPHAPPDNVLALTRAAEDTGHYA